MQKLMVSSLFLLILGMAESLQAQTKPNQNTFEEYYKECLSRTIQKKLPPDVAKELCDCTIKTFRQRYSLSQFRELVRKSNQGDRPSSQTLTAVGEACFDQVLYEE